MAAEVARLQTVIHQSNATIEEQKKQIAALSTGDSYSNVIDRRTLCI